jgi:hypothetical protein
MKDLREKILPQTLLQGINHEGTSKNSESVDLQGFGAVAFFMEVGTLTAEEGGSITPKLQVSANNSDWTDVPAIDVVTEAGEEVAIPALITDTNVRFGYSGNGRYLRVATTVAGTVTGSFYNVIAVRGEPNVTPTAFASAGNTFDETVPDPEPEE